MVAIGRNEIPTDMDLNLAHTFNLGIDRLKAKSRPLRRVQDVQDEMFKKLEMDSERRLKKKARKLREGQVSGQSTQIMAKAAENAKWYERGMNVDPLTGLQTKFGLTKKLETIYSEISRGVNKQVMLIEFDLNGFKSINDDYSHEDGDDAIKVFAESLKRATRSKMDVVARKQAGGDEFFLLIELTKNDLGKNKDEILKNIVNRVFTNVHSDLKNKKYKWDVIDTNGEKVRDENGENPIYAAVGYEVINKDNIDSLNQKRLFNSVEKQYKNDKKSLNLKKRN